MPSSSATLVEIDGIGKCFGDMSALREVSFKIPEGQICGLLGPNGAGKSTLLRLMMGFLRPTEGHIHIDGLDAFSDRVAVKRLVGFVPDEPVFYSYLSGRETLELSAAMHGLDVTAAMERAVSAAEHLNLADDLDRSADDYSRGMKKRLALMLAVLHAPKLLLLDEPTNGLDVEATNLFYNYLRNHSEQGMTVLIATHRMDDVQKLCARVVIIDRGRLVVDEAPGALRDAYKGASLEEVFLELTKSSASKQATTEPPKPEHLASERPGVE